MSRGKYSVRAFKRWPEGYELKFNSRGQIPPDRALVVDQGLEWIPELHDDGYDEEGYDYYGYSAFNRAGEFVGHGQGVDRAGWTEKDYMELRDMDAWEREEYLNSF